jgi:capsule biosynthesis phosphatase
MKKIVIDLDGTITIDEPELKYPEKRANTEVIAKLNQARSSGFYIIIHTARNMRTYSGDIELIKNNTLPVIIKWLEENEVPYDEIIIGKPFCGEAGFYVDNKSIRPSEFIQYDFEKINSILE